MPITRRLFVFILFILTSLMLILFLITRNVSYGNKKNLIVTTLFPTYDLVKEIGKDKVEVTLLLPPGTEAHSYEPKPSDIVEINKSTLFIYTNKYLETWVDEIVKGVNKDKTRVLNASDNINFIKSKEDKTVDPHVWLDLDNYSQMAKNITNKLITVDPQNREFYSNNLNEYLTKINTLDIKYRNGLKKCKNKTIVHGGHFAFGYLAKRYGLDYRAAQGFSPDAEPTANELRFLIDDINKNNIKYIFYEELTSDKIAQMIAKETDAKLLLLSAVHNVTKDDLKNHVSFLSIMEDNLVNLKKGLECYE